MMARPAVVDVAAQPHTAWLLPAALAGLAAGAVLGRVVSSGLASVADVGAALLAVLWVPLSYPVLFGIGDPEGTILALRCALVAGLAGMFVSGACFLVFRKRPALVAAAGSAALTALPASAAMDMLMSV
ncbi:hypothetical protein [Coralloluteibacterium stylophorae]|uniref:Uncharacterized protein n=1 Tax=Coralloluteibacterium stylophorae TaxID=1776034 RepID=A0A8J8AW66_9GAMM|nr:hypothetical protein [Coralloluteibacterium stylophorae]MBS7457358.1 hypothetical protein [Coralloluteibacterium stylophorae]